MRSDTFFEWLGSALGGLIRGLVHSLQYVLGSFGAALHDFSAGLGGALGMTPSAFHIALLLLGLLFLVAAGRALVRRAVLPGIVLLVLAILILGSVVH